MLTAFCRSNYFSIQNICEMSKVYIVVVANLRLHFNIGCSKCSSNQHACLSILGSIQKLSFTNKREKRFLWLRSCHPYSRTNTLMCIVYALQLSLFSFRCLWFGRVSDCRGDAGKVSMRVRGTLPNSVPKSTNTVRQAAVEVSLVENSVISCH